MMDRKFTFRERTQINCVNKSINQQEGGSTEDNARTSPFKPISAAFLLSIPKTKFLNFNRRKIEILDEILDFGAKFTKKRSKIAVGNQKSGPENPF